MPPHARRHATAAVRPHASTTTTTSAPLDKAAGLLRRAHGRSMLDACGGVRRTVHSSTCL